MRIKKFIASNMQEGREMIERELGNDAIILSNRNTKLPNGTPAIEIVAAIDNKNNTVSNTVNNTQQKKTNIYANSTVLNPTQKESVANEINRKLISEIAALKDMITDVSENVKYKYTGTMPPNLARVFKILRDSDISEELALELIGKIAVRGFAQDFNQAIGEARRIILNSLTFSNPIATVFNENSKATQQIITFLGPTGCGKTTSLIKLAIVCKLLHKAKILIVSTDTYKVGGIEQMQTLASIAGINFATAYTPDELKAIIKEENKYDIIMIDTVGRNPNNIEEMQSIAAFQNAANSTLTFLVLSATASESSLVNAIKKFQAVINNNIRHTADNNCHTALDAVSPEKTKEIPHQVRYDSKVKNNHSVIITKVDESSGLGNIISALNKYNLPLSYFATGQKIPDDIEPADNEKLNNYLFLIN